MKYCQECGNKLQLGAKFCSGCGNSLTGENPMSQQESQGEEAVQTTLNLDPSSVQVVGLEKNRLTVGDLIQQERSSGKDGPTMDSGSQQRKNAPKQKITKDFINTTIEECGSSRNTPKTIE